MKVLLMLTLYTASSFAQTTTSSGINDCFQSAAIAYTFQNIQCIQQIQDVFSLLSPPINVTDLDTLCSDSCSVALLAFVNQQCNIDFMSLACARDTVTNEYCITDANGLRLILQLASLNVSGGPCFNTDCSDITCASAVGNLSCCFETLQEFGSSFTGMPTTTFSAGLPGQCSLPEACAGAMNTSTFMSVILATMIIALVLAVYS